MLCISSFFTEKICNSEKLQLRRLKKKVTTLITVSQSTSSILALIIDSANIIWMRVQSQLQDPKIIISLYKKTRSERLYLCFLKSCTSKCSFSHKVNLRDYINIHFLSFSEECFECHFINCKQIELKEFVWWDKLLQHQRKKYEELCECNTNQICLYDEEFWDRRKSAEI